VFRCRRTLVGNHGFDFAAQTLLVKLECGLALAVEMKIRIHSHNVLLTIGPDFSDLGPGFWPPI